MKKYDGKKRIEAEPMLMGEAYELNLLQKGRVPDDEERTWLGYHVRYADGYEDWIPAEAFERTYMPADTFLERLSIEHKELHDNVDKLRVFRKSENFKELPSTEAFPMYYQLQTMQEYLWTLEYRMDELEKKPEHGIITEDMPFGRAIKALDFGLMITRKFWGNQNLIVFKYSLTFGGNDGVGNKRCPESIRKHITEKGLSQRDANSLLIYNGDNGLLGVWSPSSADIFATDWEVVTISE